MSQERRNTSLASAVDLRMVVIALLFTPLFALGAWNHAANGTTWISIVFLVLLTVDAFLCGVALGVEAVLSTEQQPFPPPCPVCGKRESVEIECGWEGQRQWRCPCGNEHWLTATDQPISGEGK